jgi:gliding motility-associated-like protein
LNRRLLFRNNILCFPACSCRQLLRNLSLLLCLLAAKNDALFGQQLPLCTGGENLASSCGGSCIVCDLNGYSNATIQVMPGSAPPGFCTQVVHNIGWVGFIAGSVNLTIEVEVLPCTLGNSIEMGIYSAPNCQNSALVSNCNTAMFQNTTYSFSNTQALNPGCVYFLVFDNNGPASCPFIVTVVSGSATAPNPGPPPTPAGPSEVCPGATVNYSIPPVLGTCQYTWTAPPGSLINGLSSPQSIMGDAGASVDITFGNTSGDVCVTTGNACAGTNQSCLPVTIAAIPPTILPPVSICAGTSLEWIDGNTYSGNQLMSATLDSWLGCDSIVQQQLIMRPQITTNLGTLLRCSNECVEVGGTSYCATGLYQVSLTSYHGCDSTVIFSLNQISVDAVIAPPGSINCLQTSVLLDGSGSTSGSNYSWYNSQNMLLGSNNTLSVSNPGTYLLVVERVVGAQTCRDSAFATVLSNTQPPTVTAEGGTINCAGDPLQLNGGSTTQGAMLTWSGPGIDSSNQHLEDPFVSPPGTYILTVLNPLNGCSATDTAIVLSMGLTPDLSVSADDTLNCFNPQLWLVAQSNMPGVAFSWMAPDSTITLSDSVLVAQNGLWIALATAPGGCINVDTSIISIDTLAPIVSATGGSLDCSGAPTAIQGSSNVPGATFSWSGPGGFSASVPDTTVTVLGAYTLTVSTPNGCTASATANVVANTNVPDISLSGGGTLTCSQTSILLTASSMTSGAGISWAGPGGFAAMSNTVQIGIPGIYTATATAPNGCLSKLNINIPIDTAAPVLSVQGDTITCNHPIGHVVSVTSGSGLQYLWTGPGVLSPFSAETDVSTGGIYILTATGANGCTASAQTSVSMDVSPPQLGAAVPPALTCTSSSALLWANSTDNGVSFSWSGPNAFSATSDTVQVNVPGNYMVTAIGLNNCRDSLLLTVPADTMPPDLIALGGMINCAQPFAQLQAQTNTPGVLFQWNGPMGFNSNAQTTTAGTAGIYQLTGTAPNGCSTIQSAQISADFTTPILTLGNTTPTLTCTDTLAQLQAQSSIAGTQFQWILLGNPFSNNAIAGTGTAGMYTLIGTAPNGCVSSDSLLVTQDINPPNVFAQGDTLSCMAQNVLISGGSSTTGASLHWTGPGNFSSSQNMPAVSQAGDYTLLVTATNGCTATAIATVFPDVSAPNLSVFPAATITCSNPTTSLMAASNTVGVMFNWSGPGNFSAAGNNAQATAAGVYSVQATAVNGCTTEQTVNVLIDTIAPVAMASSSVITCADTVAMLSGSSNTLGGVFSWTGPGNFSGNQPNASTSVPGQYLLSVTAPNGCTGSASILVQASTMPPNLMLAGGTLLTCAQTSVVLQGLSTSTNLAWVWSGPGTFSANLPNVSVNLPGTYSASITAANGCTASASIQVIQNIAPPAAQASGGTITCSAPSITLSGQSGASGASFSWAGPGNFTATGAMPVVGLPGVYLLTVTGANGCTATTTTTVSSDQLPPVFQLSGNTITCLSPSVVANASGFSSGTTFKWAGPGGFQQTGPAVSISNSGSYQVTAQGANGCTATQSLQIGVDTISPSIELEGGMLTCRDSLAKIKAVLMPSSALLSWAGPQQFLPAIPEISVELPGLYTLTATASNGCSAVQDFLLEEIVPDWTVSLGPDQTVWEGAFINLKAETLLPKQDMADIQWQPGFPCADCLSQGFRVRDTMYVEVQIEDAYGCVMRDGVWINVRKRGAVYIPNVFSPDDDGENDVFRVFAGNPATRIHFLRIYDRWGSQVFGQEDFSPDELRGSWDGRYRGNVLQPAVFVWMLSIEYEDGTLELLSGDVFLKR